MRRRHGLHPPDGKCHCLTLCRTLQYVCAHDWLCAQLLAAGQGRPGHTSHGLAQCVRRERKCRHLCCTNGSWCTSLSLPIMRRKARTLSTWSPLNPFIGTALAHVRPLQQDFFQKRRGAHGLLLAEGGTPTRLCHTNVFLPGTTSCPGKMTPQKCALTCPRAEYATVRHVPLSDDARDKGDVTRYEADAAGGFWRGERRCRQHSYSCADNSPRRLRVSGSE